MNKIFTTALFFAFTASTTLFAQVKIGTNPTSIDPTNNLEVEASTPDRVIAIDKTTGKVTIKDGTEGDGKILTSDINGTASWKTPLSQNTELWIYAKSTVDQAIPTGYTKILFDTELEDRGNNFSPGTSQVIVPSSGIYQVNAGLKKVTNTSSTFNIGLTIYVNGTSAFAGYDDSWTENAKPNVNISNSIFLNAGDVVDVRIKSSFAKYSIAEGHFTMIKLSN